MKVTHSKQYGITLCFTILIGFISSCSTQSQPDQHIQKVEANDEGELLDPEIDTSLQLRFLSGIRSILEDSQGNFWFGSHQEGVCLFDGEKMTYFTIHDGLSSNQIRSIFEDSNGIIWFEGGEGISSYDGKKITTQNQKDYSLKGQWQSSENDLWFKGDEPIGNSAKEERPGVYRYDGETFTFLEFPVLSDGNNELLASISTPFFRGKSGMLWFGTYDAVIGYDNNPLRSMSSRFTVINNESLGYDKQTGSLHVRSILEDSKGNLWIGNNGIGVLLRSGNSTINFSVLQGLISSNSLRSGGYRSPPNSLEHVFSIGEDLEGNIWFGDRDTGAWKYDGKSMKNYTAKDGLTTTHIWQIYTTKNGELWFAMADGNVLRFNGTSFENVF